MNTKDLLESAARELEGIKAKIDTLQNDKAKDTDDLGKFDPESPEADRVETRLEKIDKSFRRYIARKSVLGTQIEQLQKQELSDFKTQQASKIARQQQASAAGARKVNAKMLSIESELNALVDIAFPLVWGPDGLNPLRLGPDFKLTGIAQTFFWDRIHRFESEIYAGTRARPVVDMPPVFEVAETPAQRLENLQTELREAERMLPGLVEYRDRCTINGFGSDKVGNEKLEKAEKAVVDTREQITRLKDEIKKGGTPK